MLDLIMISIGSLLEVLPRERALELKSLTPGAVVFQPSLPSDEAIEIALSDPYFTAVSRDLGRTWKRLSD